MTDFQHIKASFITFITYQKRLSTLSIKHYVRDLDMLEKLLPIQPKDIKTEHIRQVILILRKKMLSTQTVSRMLSVWRQFFLYAVRESYLVTTPMQRIIGPKKKKRLPGMLSTDQIHCFLNVLYKKLPTVSLEKQPLLIRDIAIIELFYSSGLRLSELTYLDYTPDVIDLSNKWIRVIGKGGHERLVPLGDYAVHALRQWLDVRHSWKTNNNALFINIHGGRLSDRSIQLRIRALSSELSQYTLLHPHLFRHSFASHVLESSNDLRAVQEMLGHRSLSSTQVYTHLNFQALSHVYDCTHPRAIKKNNTPQDD